MKKNFSFIKERIRYIATNKGLKLGEFYNELGVSSTAFSGEKIKGDVKTGLIEKIISIHPEVNLHWLITGIEKIEDDKNVLGISPINSEEEIGVLKFIADFKKLENKVYLAEQRIKKLELLNEVNDEIIDSSNSMKKLKDQET